MEEKELPKGFRFVGPPLATDTLKAFSDYAKTVRADIAAATEVQRRFIYGDFEPCVPKR